MHEITAIITAHAFDAECAQRLDLVPVLLGERLTLFHIDHYYSAYWQAVRRCTEPLDVPSAFPVVFPRESVLVQLVSELTGLLSPAFGLIQTEYFGGIGGQWACAFTGARRDSAPTASINDVLRILGVARSGDLDEFDTVGLGGHRRSPEHLERYVALCEELGV